MSEPPTARAPRGLGIQTASRAVAEQLRLEIERGELAPGTRLRQIEVAERFGVSTTPVREAFAFLEAEGLLQNDPRRGTVVFRPTVEDLHQCFKIRMALEPLALAEAVPRLDEAELDSLQELVDTMRVLEDHAAWLELNDDFHLRLYRAAGNRRLLDIVESLRKASRYYIHLFVVHNLRSHRADDEHQEILDACRARDQERARRAALAHLEQTMSGVLGFLGDGAAS